MSVAELDAIVLAGAPDAAAKVLGLTLAERGRRVAGRLGARRVLLLAGPSATAAVALAEWERERGDAALLVIRASDQLVHMPLAAGLLTSSGDRRLAVAPDGSYAGALWASGAAAAEVIAALAADPLEGDRALAARWADATRVVHGEIARHPATTPAERRGAARLLLQLLVKAGEDSPVSKYVYRPLSRPLTVLLLRTPITANQVSYAVGVIGLIGCWLTAQASQSALIWGSGLVFASGIIDGCDGEISRMRLTSSSFGAWLDTVIDELTQVTYFLAIGYHTYRHHPEPWVAASIAVGAVCFLATIYGIYYFSIVVIKKGGSQYYVGDLEIVDDALRPRVKQRTAPPWLRSVGQVLLYVIRRDFINLAAFALTFANLYAVIYGGILVGTVVAGVIVVPEHLRLRRQLRELARRGIAPRMVAA